jgi:hypothetical protein
MTARGSYVSFKHAVCHHHSHRKSPHVHARACDRFDSGFDKNRQSRFYFTKFETPVRVYVTYNERLLQGLPDTIKELKEHNTKEYKENKDNNNDNLVTSQSPTTRIMNNLIYSNQINQGGRKLSPRTLRHQLRISPKFIEEAKNYLFIKESLSFVPQAAATASATNQTIPPALTYAEMAVLPPIKRSISETIPLNSENFEMKLANNSKGASRLKFQNSSSISTRATSPASKKSSTPHLLNRKSIKNSNS